MNGLKRILTTEPAAITGFLQAVITMVVLFGVPITTEQSAAILTTTGLGLALITRAMVTPTAKAEEAVKDAKADAKAEAIVERAMSPAPTAEEWATVQELRAERDRLTVEQLARDRAARGRTS